MIFMDKEQLQKDIDTKKNELDSLKSKILVEVEQSKKKTLEDQQKKLEEEIHTLEIQLDDLKKLEKSTAVTEIDKEKKALKDDIEPDSDWSYEIIKWSKMHTKLLTILWSEAKVETFAWEIDRVVRKYLDQELEWFSNSIKNSMSVGIQFAMMETLIKQWPTWSAQFFEAFGNIKTQSTSKAFEWLFTSFSTLWTANEFYVLANKVQNLTRYLSDKKNTIIQSQNIPQLIDPYQFKLLLSNPIWSNQAQIDKLDISTLLTLNSSTPVDIHAWESELKKIINNENISNVITDTTISAMQKALTAAEKLLDSRGKFQDTTSDLVDNIAWFLNINIPFFGNLWELVWVDFPTDILWKQKESGIINFALGVLGYPWGLTWLHKKYIQEKIDGMDIDNSFIAAAYADFQKNTDATISHDSPTSVWKICWLSAPDSTIETAIKTKIPTNYVGLKKSLTDNISNATLDPTMVAKFAPNAIITQNWKNIVDTTKITDKDAFVDMYLKYIIPVLANPEKDFITSDKIDSNNFALAVIGGLVGDKYFIEWISIWLLTATDFKRTTNTPTAAPTPSYENIDETDPELVRLSTWPNEHYAENEKFKKYLHTLEGKNGLPYGIMLNLMKAESGGMLYKADGTTIIWSTAGAKWLFQFMPATAKSYSTKIWLPVSEYEKVFTNPIIWSKACAQFLKDRLDAGDNTVNILAHYNAWPWVISGKKVTPETLLQLPKETQKYVLKIWYSMLEYSGKATIITSAQKENPYLIDASTLVTFMAAVNALPPAGIPTPIESHELLSQDNYKQNTMFVGDSLTVGYAAYPEVNGVKVPEISWYRSLGSKMGGKRTGWMNDHFDEATNVTPKPKTVVVLGWVNDLCNYALTNITPGAKVRDAQTMADDIFKNITAMSDKSVAAGIKFAVWTLLPFDGFLEKQSYASQQPIIHDAMKLINDKIKTTRPDTYIDFTTPFTDTTNPWHLPSHYDSGDGVHLNVSGYKKMQELAFTKRKQISTQPQQSIV